LQKFCRSPPREFNTAQRAAFCVYSGPGIPNLKRYLDDMIKAHNQQGAKQQAGALPVGTLGPQGAVLTRAFRGDLPEDSSEDDEETVVGSGRRHGVAPSVRIGMQAPEMSRRINGNGFNGPNGVNGHPTRNGLGLAIEAPSSASSSTSTSTSALPSGAFSAHSPLPVPAFDEPVYPRNPRSSPTGSGRSSERSGRSDQEGTTRGGEEDTVLGPSGTAPRGRRTLRSKLSDAGALLFGRSGSNGTNGEGSGRRA